MILHWFDYLIWFINNVLKLQWNKWIPNSIIIPYIYVASSNGIRKRMIVNIDIWSDWYLSCSTKFAVYYAHIVRWLTCLNIVCNFIAKRYPTVKKKLSSFITDSSHDNSCKNIDPEQATESVPGKVSLFNCCSFQICKRKSYWSNTLNLRVW